MTRPVALSSLLTLALLAPIAGCGDDAPAEIQLSGTAYVFNTPDPLPDAVIRVAELPDLEAVSDADGNWELTVPDGQPLTPYVEAEGYVTMYHQTFTGAGEDLEHVFFQCVTQNVFDTFAQILGIVPDPELCQIATTVNEIAIQGMDFPEFSAHGHHGVADATVTVEPSAGLAVYFTEQTIPNYGLDATTIDGGVVWTNVAPGTYTFTAHHADQTFATFTATCEPGRFLNPSPPWGLYELVP